MYPIVLIFCAFLILSLFATNWPLKLYHHAVLTKAGKAIGARPARGSLFAGVYSEIRAPLAGREVRIRYVEGSMDAIHAASGLEMRIPLAQPAVIEFYRVKLKKAEWGEFKRVFTGDEALDREWVILGNDPELARQFLRASASAHPGAPRHPLVRLLTNRHIEQILFHSREMIIRFQKGDPVDSVIEVFRILPDFFLLPEFAVESNLEPGDY